MRSMSTVEYAFAIEELRPRIQGKHLSRIRKVGERSYRLKIGDCEIIAELGVRLHQTLLIEKPLEADKLCQKAEKELDNARLITLDLVNDDRIIEFRFDKGSIIFEMFGKGNAILVKDGITIAAYSYESWSGREIKAGAPYSPPERTSSWTPLYNDKYIAVSLMKLPLGKDYVHEALGKAGIGEKTPGSQISPGKRAELERAIEGIRSSLSPIVFYQGEQPIELSLIHLTRLKDALAKPFPSFGVAADEFFSKRAAENPRLEQLERRLEKQHERMKELLEEEAGYKAVGDAIYSNYEAVQNAIDLAKSGKFEEVPGIDMGKINKKDRSMEIELQ